MKGEIELDTLVDACIYKWLVWIPTAWIGDCMHGRTGLDTYWYNQMIRYPHRCTSICMDWSRSGWMIWCLYAWTDGVGYLLIPLDALDTLIDGLVQIPTRWIGDCMHERMELDTY